MDTGFRMTWSTVAQRQFVVSASVVGVTDGAYHSRRQHSEALSLVQPAASCQVVCVSVVELTQVTESSMCVCVCTADILWFLSQQHTYLSFSHFVYSCVDRILVLLEAQRVHTVYICCATGLVLGL